MYISIACLELMFGITSEDVSVDDLISAKALITKDRNHAQ
jgi:hypothetical protein